MSHAKDEKKCFFTGCPAETNPAKQYDEIFLDEIIVRDSSEEFINWRYLLSKEVIYAKYIDKKTKLKCVSETIWLNDAGLVPLWVLDESSDTSLSKVSKNIVVKRMKNFKNIPIEHSQKPARLLHLIAKKIEQETNDITDPVTLWKRDMYKVNIFSDNELWYWLGYLKKIGYLECEHFMGDGLPEPAMTPEGWSKIEESAKTSGTVFVAMAFTDFKGNKLDNDPLRNAIRDACKAAGWEAATVDKQEFNDGIMDEIKAMIHKAPFVIADITHQKTGVYYEAGYALGRGIPIIHTVSKSDHEGGKCHFDVSHLNLIVYEDENDLRKRLQNRIEGSPDIGKASQVLQEG